MSVHQYIGLACVLIVMVVCIRLSRNSPLGWVFIVYGFFALIFILAFNELMGYFWPPACTLRESVFLDSLVGCGSTVASAGWGLIAGGVVAVLRSNFSGN